MQVANLEQFVEGAWGAPWCNFFLSEVADPWARVVLSLREAGRPRPPLDTAASISPADFDLVRSEAGFGAAAGAPAADYVPAAHLVGALSDAWFAFHRGL
jgi:hypothetical protein